ncbi:MAG: transposase domain-containing protein [Pseudonocardia sp.]|nr:transposase domain-containing protein [Pseudonocardia sp.]
MVVRPDQVSLGVLVNAVPRDAVDEAVAVCGVREKPSDAELPAHVITYLTLRCACSLMMTTPRSRPRSPGRWIGGAAGMRPGRCRPLGRSPRPVSALVGKCSRSCSNAAAARSRARPGRPRRRWRWARRAGRSCDGGGCWPSTGSRSTYRTTRPTPPSSATPGPDREPVGVPQGSGGRTGRVQHPRVRGRRGRRLLVGRGEDCGAAAVPAAAGR